VPGLSWPSLEESASKRLSIGWGGAVQVFGIYGNGTSSGELLPSLMPNGAGARPFSPPLQRVHIERVACTDPAAYGLHLARWDCRSLQQVVVERAVVGAIHYTTVARILAAASLQPHRSRYWKTATIDERFTTKAARILWRYERVAWLYERDEVVLCLDEKPNLQALARRVPTQPMRPGQIERREFEYTRHGTVTFFVALNVYDGTMWGCCLEANDHAHFLGALGRLVRRYPRAQRLHLILDNGSSHIAQETKAYLASHPRLRAFYTPPHASWLNQAELLLRAFSDKYLRRSDSLSRQQLIDHLEASWPEYNRRFAHPFTWSWSCRDLYAWARKKAAVICSKTYATVH
jgi:transposase